jgi:hypothetical protein
MAIKKKAHKDTDKKAVKCAFLNIPCLLLPRIKKERFSKYMDNIQNTRGKGYCMLYLVMFLFLFTAFVLMLCNRGSLLDFTR